MKTGIRILLWCFVLGSLSGCFSVAEKKRENALEKAMNEYRIAMRWGRWDTLMGFRAVDAPPVPELDLDNVRVTAYEIRQPPVPMGEDVVVQVVGIEYVLNDLQRLRKLTDRQEWRLDEKTDAWELHSPFPDFN